MNNSDHWDFDDDFDNSDHDDQSNLDYLETFSPLSHWIRQENYRSYYTHYRENTPPL